MINFSKYVILVFSSLVCLNTRFAHAQQQINFTLDECIQYALKHNLNIKNAQIEVQRTKQKTNTYLAKIFPTISLDYNYKYFTEIPTTLIPSSVFGGPEEVFSEVQFGSPQSTTAGLGLKQVIYNHAALIGLRAIKPLQKNSVLQLEKTKEDIVYNVSATFYNIQITDLTITMLDSNLNSFRQTIKNMETLANQNLSAENDVVKIKVQAQRIRNRLQDVKSNKKKLQNLMKFLLKIPVENQFDIVHENINQLRQFYTILPTKPVKSLRPIELQNIQIGLLKIEKAVAISSFMPQVSLSANYSYSGNNNDFNPFQTIDDKWFPSSFVSLAIKIPLFDGLQSIYTRKVKNFEYTKAQNSLELLKANLKRQILDAFNDYQAKKEIELTSKDILDMYTKLFQDDLVKYELGIISLDSFLRTQDNLTTTQMEYVTSLVNLKKSELDYKKITNEILSK